MPLTLTPNCTSHWASGISHGGGATADHAGRGDGRLDAPEVRDSRFYRRPHVRRTAHIADHRRTAPRGGSADLLEVGLRGEGVIQSRIVGQRSTATTCQPAATRRSTVAAPMPRAAPVTTATGLTTGASATTRPRSGRARKRRGARVPLRRPHPWDHPARRWTIPVAPLRRADGAARWRSARRGPARPDPSRTASGAMASSRDVSVRPAWASPLRHGAPDEHVIALGRRRGARTIDERLLVPAVGVDENHARKGAAGGTHELDEQVGQDLVPDEQRAREVGVLAARPVGHGGRHGDARTARGQPGGTAPAMRVSVSSGRWGPCCSSEPSGTASTGPRPGRLHLAPGGAGELHGLRCGPASGGGRAWAPGSGSRPGRPWSGRAPTAVGYRVRPTRPRRARARTRDPGRRGAAR